MVISVDYSILALYSYKNTLSYERVFRFYTTPILFLALDGQKAVLWILTYFVASWQVGAFWALVLAEVVDCLLFATAKGYLL